MVGPMALRMLPARSSSSVALRPQRLCRRSYATTKQPGPTSQFYKTFTRPVAKVLLLAVFTYQVAYWSWTKLEADEIRADTDATIAGLEATVHEYKKPKEAPKGS